VITLYGLKNCDTCRKASKWLAAKGIKHRLHDVRAEGVSAEQISAWTSTLGWEAVLNRRSTTWREIPEKEREGLNEARAVALMAKHPTLIKRPVIDTGRIFLVGFTKATEAALLENAGA
jgi:Spx/MgsR family transcriptional regulator